MTYREIVLKHLDIEALKKELEEKDFKGFFYYQLYSDIEENYVSVGLFKIL